MARPRQPIAVIQAKGKKNLTKAEIEERKKQEARAPTDNVKPPKFLNSSQKKEFEEVADILVNLDVLTNLSCDSLGMYFVNRDLWIEYTKELQSLVKEKSKLQREIKKLKKENTKKSLEEATDLRIINIPAVLDHIQIYSRLQERSFKQARLSASDNGLTVDSLLNLAIPQPKGPPKQNKFIAKMSGDT